MGQSRIIEADIAGVIIVDGYSEPFEQLQLKETKESEADVVRKCLYHKIGEILKEKKLSRQEEAALLGIHVEALSKLKNCRPLKKGSTFYSFERLIEFLNRLGWNVDLNLIPPRIEYPNERGLFWTNSDNYEPESETK